MLPRTIYPRRCRGFSLVDVMIGAALLALAGIAFSATFPMAARLNSQSRYRAQAVRIAQREMESLRRLPFGQLDSLPSLQAATPRVIDATTSTQPYSFSQIETDGINQVSVLLPNGQGNFTIENVTLADPEVVSAGQTNLRRITVRVLWTERGQNRSVLLQTLVSNTVASSS